MLTCLRRSCGTIVTAGVLLATWDDAFAQVASPPAEASNPAPDARADTFWQAARKGDAAAITQLLDQGVDVNTRFRYGATALSYASDRGHLAIVKMLLARGANPNVKDTFYGATPLSWASSPAQGRKPEHVEIVRLLLEAGAQGQGDALMAAIGAGDEPMARVVVEHGRLSADALADALEEATTEKQTGIVTLLTTAGAKARPIVTLTAPQLARCAGEFGNGGTIVSLAVKDGTLQGGPPGQTLTLVPRSETTFGVAGQPGVTLVFSLGPEGASSVTLNRRQGPPVVYTRVEGK